MKRLILMRHAKSDWSAGASSDHDRPLNKRGRNAAAHLGDWLREHDLVPDQVLSSSAMRTKETLARLALPDGIATNFTRDLYLATHNEIMTTVQTATGNVVLLIGHNPGISIMASEAIVEQPVHPKFDAYPSGATMVADFDITDWHDAGWGNANARHFVVPREL